MQDFYCLCCVRGLSGEGVRSEGFVESQSFVAKSLRFATRTR